MRSLDWVAIGLAILLGGWLLFDGSRALVVGDYVTPRTGRFAGKLGPWSRLVTSVGLEPRSTWVKCIHAGIGLSWIAAGALFAVHAPMARRGMLVCAVASLWYLPFGTLISVIQIVLVQWPSARRSR